MDGRVFVNGVVVPVDVGIFVDIVVIIAVVVDWPLVVSGHPGNVYAVNMKM